MARQHPRKRPLPPKAKPDPIRPEYDRLGPDTYYAEHAHDYANPHEPIVRRLLDEWYENNRPVPTTRILDLACGSGEVTAFFQGRGFRNIMGVDPYTGPAYFERTGIQARSHDFVAIARGAMAGSQFDVVFCSFALHLAEPGLLPQVCLALREIAAKLVVLTPHKRPEIKPEWGWLLVDETKSERVRRRHYEIANPT